MSNFILVISVAVLYGILTIWQRTLLLDKTTSPPRQWWLIVVITLFLHALLLYHFIDVGEAQNLSLFNLFSLVCWLVVIVMVGAIPSKPLGNLGFFTFPLAACSVLLTGFFPSSSLVHTAADPKGLIHILLSTIAFSVLCVAALQAVLLTIQEYYLRHTKAFAFIQKLPPLEVMEKLLFQLITLGFILLTLVLSTSFLFFSARLHSALLPKILLSVFAWLVFVGLLSGRFYFGWRGPQAVRWTLAGVFLVMLTYYGGTLLW